MNSHLYRYPSGFFDREPNKWITQFFMPALAIAATVFFGLEAIENRDPSPHLESGQNTGQICESFYKEMDELTESGLAIEGLAQIEDSREDVCGPAHTVPYVWEVQPPQTDEGTEENQLDEGASPAEAE